MPYLRAESTVGIGLFPAGGYAMHMTNEYLVATSYASAIFAGDPMVMTSSSPIHGSVTNTYTSAQYGTIVGVAAMGLAASVGSTAFKVYDDPRQLFAIRANLESTGGTQNIIGSAFSVSTAGTANSAIGRSNVFLKTSAATAGAGMAFRVLALHPIETGGHVATSSGTTFRTVLGYFANHIQMQTSEAVGVTST